MLPLYIFYVPICLLVLGFKPRRLDVLSARARMGYDGSGSGWRGMPAFILAYCLLFLTHPTYLQPLVGVLAYGTALGEKGGDGEVVPFV
jgi:hypothetical protein